MKKKLNLITSLRKLFKAFSKEDTNSNNVADLVDKIADSVSKNTVPKPTIEDAGKIIMIDKDGSYILNEPKDSANAVLYTQQTLTNAQQEQARENIGAVSLDEIGRVFRLKGGVPTVEDLPASGNTVGDVYYVEAVSAGYIWLTSTSQPNGYWEELGETFDVTVDSELSATSENPVQNKVINAALAKKGTYSKPSGGIPKTDLVFDVQTSLLPAVSASDNEKFLRVINGAWAAAIVPSAETTSF